MAPGIFVGDFGCLKKVTDSPDADYRFRAFTGCACWEIQAKVPWPATGGDQGDGSPFSRIPGVCTKPRVPGGVADGLKPF